MSAAESSIPRTDLRFDLKSLLWGMAIVAALLVPIRWFGGLYLFSVASSAALVGACCYAYRYRSGGRACGYAITGLILAFPFGMLVVLGHAFLNLLLCSVLVACRVRPRTFSQGVIALAILIYGVVLWNGFVEVRTLEALRQKYPFESLVARLKFRDEPQTNSNLFNAALSLSPAVAGRLDDLEHEQTEVYGYGRSQALQQLHENTRMQFAFAAGFGPARMPMLPGIRWVELPNERSLLLPATVNVATEEPSADELYSVHRGAVVDFADADRMGYIRSRTEVAGFESHRVARIDDPWDSTGSTDSLWQVTRLELVGLLRETEPRVYTTGAVLPMDQMAESPHRNLNSFEAAALPQLESSEDVVIEQTAERIEMLGAVRATSACLECHDAQRGQLLGAFSYEMVRLQGAAEPFDGDRELK